MEMPSLKRNIPLNTLLCLEYNFSSHSRNTLSFSEQISKYTQIKNIDFKSLFKHKDIAPSIEDSSLKSESEDTKQFTDKRNYKEEELFTNPKELNNNQYLNNKHINPIIQVMHFQLKEKEEEIDRVILNINSNFDNKIKMQNIKKIISYFKKNRNNKLTLSNFFLKLSQQINEDPIVIQKWIEYEYIKHKIENCLISINKEFIKYLTITNNAMSFKDQKPADTNVVHTKITIHIKYEELMRLSKEENELVERFPKIMTLSEKYNHLKLKKKNTSHKEKLIKRVVDLFAKHQRVITNEDVVKEFLTMEPTFEVIKDEYNNSNSMNNNNNIPMQEQINKNDQMVLLDKNEDFVNIEISPPKGKKYKVKQFNEEDFEIIIKEIICS